MLSKTKKQIIFVSFFIVLIFDRLIKYYFLKVPKNIILNNYISLETFKNYGLSFGISTENWLSILFSVSFFIILILFLILNKKNKYNINNILLILILISTSNLYDRLYYGYVIDYFNVFNLVIFNLVDIFIIILTGILIFKILKNNDK
ncbi:signal peptidase II [Patescibacteria group bacterium]|nr:signal peptidase II [Patescibacteria group bacterium]